MFGTKCPSITSRWIQSAPAASTARTSSPSLEKSDARIDGAMTRGRGARGMGGFRSFGGRRIFAGNMGEPDGQPRAENSAATAAIAGIEVLPLRQKALVLS